MINPYNPQKWIQQNGILSGLTPNFVQKFKLIRLLVKRQRCIKLANVSVICGYWQLWLTTFTDTYTVIIFVFL